MFLSVFDMFKVGIGPSSSHTMGPMVAAGMFLDLLRESPFEPTGLRAQLHGSLAYTGIGHATDRAILLGLAGFRPATFNATEGDKALSLIKNNKVVNPDGLPQMKIDPAIDILFDYGPALPGHANGLILTATDQQGDVLMQQTYYSVGGGFVVTEEEITSGRAVGDLAHYPHEFETASALLEICVKTGKSITEIKRENELSRRSALELDRGLAEIWDVMSSCIDRGLVTDGILPGGLNVKRRAKGIHDSLVSERGINLSAPHTINDWMSVYAMAVNEENAAGGQVVTAPTNGAAGVIPATIRYWLDHVPGANNQKVSDFLLTAAAIGGLIKSNASISGAECGCQAEVGSAAAMAAAGLCAVLGGSPAQVENAAEIALEHHLGMTCDPIKGLVQVPCIERNGLGCIKAVSAASLAMRGDGTHLVPLDACIETMRQTGKDMHEKYKETSQGGLAVNLPNC
ncbi:L-serine ammonia-lyase [Planktomarina sp.]|nr:L-serine ammonia-lyase [Planktomarina sp.]MDA9099771.1 L-serine ammonia-lyase [Planktomarina sp.]